MKKFITTMILLAFSFGSYASLKSINIMTEEYPPFNFKGADGQPTGMAVDILIEAYKRAGVPLSKSKIKLLPWARGYQSVQKPGAKNMLFSMTRTDSRESLFKWVGPYVKSYNVFFALKSKGIKITSPDQIKNYKIAGVRGDIGLVLATQLGAKEKQLMTVNKFSLLPKLLKKGRADLFSYNEQVSLWLMKKQGVNPNDFEVVYKGEPPSEFYYAFNLSVSDADIDKLQKAVEEVTSDSAFMDNVNKKYK
ncbi:substrate-binding periplasmic protein [Piscirickettsia litoralis]|uniref:Solute-binding protein family 3/N-terminal domain-containing protein n=1 Tax=Piscirickettsia litoralis TaxID=1891921 RepID=A0ABX3A5N4_9GAMM|nr:transporter substrate-binding domain-containing protein [Piscirickettsia litoralis]ODN41429.1 hypothetical protein BGC07_16840 [Piscirickettsia litoralis]